MLRVYTAIASVLIICTPILSSSWRFLPQLRIAALGTAHSPLACDLIPRLSMYQRRTCRMKPALMTTVAEGIRTGVAECQKQFVNYRWNCTSIQRNGIGQIVLKPGSSESAFVYAVTSAGVMYSIATACSKGDLSDCHCDRRWTNVGRGSDQQGPFLWGGCSDDIPYSSKVARRFVDASDTGSKDGRALMNLHNNRAGRKLVRRSLEKRCKCHGVSGSCAMRTCWYSLSNFNVIGSALRHKYDTALRVTINSQGAGLMPLSSNFLADRRHDSPLRPSPLSTASRPPTKIDSTSLVFFDPSPDYCNSDPVLGYPGTAGRPCNRSSDGPDGCDSMCCGRGFDTTRRLRTYKCECRFIYCCDVVCKQCSEWEDVNTCKAEPNFTMD